MQSMGSLFLTVVIVSCEILVADLTSAELALNRAVEFELLGHSATTHQHRVFASSVRGSKQRCTAGCARQKACTRFCYEPTTKQCLFEDADSDDQEQTGNFTCYIRSINPVCTSTYYLEPHQYKFPFPPFGDDEFLLDFAVRTNHAAKVVLSTDDTRTGIKYHLVLGQLANTVTTIRRCASCLTLHTVPSEGVVSPLEMRRFWLRYDHGNFALGKHQQAAYFEWSDTETPATPVRFYGLGSWGVEQTWVLYNICY